MQLIDRIYEAAVCPEEWPNVLHNLAATAEAAGGALTYRCSDAYLGWTYSMNVAPGADEYLRSEAAVSSLSTPRLVAANRAGFVANHEVMSDEEYRQDPLVTNWCAPNKFFHAAATYVAMPAGDVAVVHIQRREGEPKFDTAALGRLDIFRPDLARAAMLAARWRMKQLQTATEALALIGVAAAVLDASGRVVAANSLMQNLTPYVTWRARDGIALTDRLAHEQLGRILTTARQAGQPPRGTFPAASSANERAIVHVVPLTLSAREVFNGGCSLLIVSPITSADPIDMDLIQGLFDLTATEANVARAISEGLDRVQTATRQGVSVETVRSQMKSIFAKTGTRRQSELVGLIRGLNRISPARPEA